MLCPTCPKRPTCQTMCRDLRRELSRIEGFQFETLQSPRDFAKTEAAYVVQNYLHAEQSDVPERDPFSEAGQTTLERALADLTLRQRECVEMYYWDGLSHNQIALKLSLSRQTVAQHIQAALIFLRKNYSEQLGDLLEGDRAGVDQLPASLHI